jgi:hypothetical protein
MLETFNKTQLKKIIRFYNLHYVIKKYSKMDYAELLSELKKVIKIDADYNIHFHPRVSDQLLSGEETKKLIKYKQPKIPKPSSPSEQPSLKNKKKVKVEIRKYDELYKTLETKTNEQLNKMMKSLFKIQISDWQNIPINQLVELIIGSKVKKYKDEMADKNAKKMIAYFEKQGPINIDKKEVEAPYNL